MSANMNGTGKMRKLNVHNGGGAISVMNRNGSRDRSGEQVSDGKRITRSRPKIPQGVRYELENALLGLCDVWFDEIKPHLVQHGIKVHCHRADAVSPPPCPRQLLDSVVDHAADCPHLESGAAHVYRARTAGYASCCSIRPSASTVRSPKLRARPSPQAHRLNVKPLQPLRSRGTQHPPTLQRLRPTHKPYNAAPVLDPHLPEMFDLETPWSGDSCTVCAPGDMKPLFAEDLIELLVAKANSRARAKKGTVNSLKKEEEVAVLCLVPETVASAKTSRRHRSKVPGCRRSRKPTPWR